MRRPFFAACLALLPFAAARPEPAACVAAMPIPVSLR